MPEIQEYTTIQQLLIKFGCASNDAKYINYILQWMEIFLKGRILESFRNTTITRVPNIQYIYIYYLLSMKAGL
jgi:hypothetical protein